MSDHPLYTGRLWGALYEAGSLMMAVGIGAQSGRWAGVVAFGLSQIALALVLSFQDWMGRP